MNLSDHVRMNRNDPAPNPSENISDQTRQCLRPRWGRPSPKIRITKVPATNAIDVIMLKSTIQSQLVKSYFTQVKTVKIFLLRNLSSCEF